MSRKALTDLEVEMEIERLTKSDAVLLARQEQRLAYRKRQYLYQLRWYEKRGIELQKQGITYEDLKRQEEAIEVEGNEEEQEIKKSNKKRTFNIIGDCSNGIVCPCFVSIIVSESLWNGNNGFNRRLHISVLECE